MDQWTPRRIWIAFLLAPIATVPVFVVCTTAVLIARGAPAADTLVAAVHTSFFIACFGLPIAYAVEFLVGMPLYRRLQTRHRLRARGVLAVAALIGAVVMPAVWRVMFGPTVGWEAIMPVGALMGLAAGATFARICLRGSPSRPAV